MNLNIDFTGRGHIILDKTNLATRRDGRLCIFLEPYEIEELKTKSDRDWETNI